MLKTFFSLLAVQWVLYLLSLAVIAVLCGHFYMGWYSNLLKEQLTVVSYGVFGGAIIGVFYGMIFGVPLGVFYSILHSVCGCVIIGAIIGMIFGMFGDMLCGASFFICFEICYLATFFLVCLILKTKEHHQLQYAVSN
jgi:hypothetical protein